MLTTVAASLASAVRSVERRTALVDESSKLKAVVEHATDGIAVLSSTGRVRLWSPAMARITGVTEAGAMTDVVSIPEALTALVKAAHETEPADATPARTDEAPVTISLKRPDGELRAMSRVGRARTPLRRQRAGGDPHGARRDRRRRARTG